MRAFSAIFVVTLIAVGWLAYSIAGSIEYDVRVSLPNPTLPGVTCPGVEKCERVVHLVHNPLRCTLLGKCVDIRL